MPSESNTGTWVFDTTLQKLVKVSDRIPNISRFEVAGSRVYCDPNGETLDFGAGSVDVRDATEKRQVMQKHGVMEAQGKWEGPKYDPDTVPTFAEHFREETGTSLDEAGPSLIHTKE